MPCQVVELTLITSIVAGGILWGHIQEETGKNCRIFRNYAHLVAQKLNESFETQLPEPVPVKAAVKKDYR